MGKATKNGRVLHVIVPWKESARFPGKNNILYGKTAAYIKEFSGSWPEACGAVEMRKVLLVGAEGSVPKDLPPASDMRDGASTVVIGMGAGWSQHDVIREYLRRAGAAKDDFVVLLQVTQPVRRDSLVNIALRALALKPGRDLVTSYVLWEDDRWRTLHGKDVEGAQQHEFSPCMLYDGAVYAWRAGKVAALSDLPKDGVRFVYNYTGPVVDIDYEWQLEGVNTIIEKLGKPIEYNETATDADKR